MVLIKPPSTQNYLLQRKWWNRPLIGNKSVTERIVALFKKKEIDATTLALHKDAVQTSESLIRRAQAIDHEKFGNKEFLSFVRIKYALAKGTDQYKNLERNVQFFRVGIETNKIFISLEQIEFIHRGIKFGEFYAFVESLFDEKLNQIEFQEKLNQKFSEFYPILKTKEGKTALRSYVKQLGTLSEHKFGLKLLASFKKNKLTNYSILKIISDIIRNFKRNDLLDLKSMTVQVIAHYDSFEKLGRVIGVSDHHRNPETYARMLQYIALGEKYETAYPKFQEMVNLLKEWEKHYSLAHSIRAQYKSREYKKPKEFLQPLSGMDLFRKYQDYFN